MRLLIGIFAAICAVIGYGRYHQHQLREQEQERRVAERDNARRLDSIIQVEAARAAAIAHADSVRAAFAVEVHDRRMALPPARVPDAREAKRYFSQPVRRPAGPP